MIPASGAGGRGFDSPLAPLLHAWGISSIGRVRRSQRRGTGIETRILHLLPTGPPLGGQRQKEFPNRELNPGLTGESRVS